VAVNAIGASPDHHAQVVRDKGAQGTGLGGDHVREDARRASFAIVLSPDHARTHAYRMYIPPFTSMTAPVM
jgi:hypothetical protein